MHPSDAPIELAVYACRGDTLLFVPALCLPPHEAETAFGPLARIGSVTVHARDGAWHGITTQIERHLFATVPRPEGELLVGIATGASAAQDA